MAKLIVGGYNLDLPLDFEILITREIADVASIDERSSDWSKTFTLPGSKENKQAFSHLFELETKIRNTSTTNLNPDFNPNLRATAEIYIDEVPFSRGVLRLLNVVVLDSDSIEFECSFHGELAGLITKIQDKLLSDLDFTAFNHTLTAARVTESWDTRIQKNGSNYTNFSGGFPTGEGYVYCLIDDGTWVNYYGDTHVAQFKPALYLKEIVDRIFSEAGYSYTSDSFFNSQLFKRLIVPCPTGMILSETAAANRTFEAVKTSGTSGTFLPGVTFTTFDTENFDYSNQFDTGTSKFTSVFGGAVYDFGLYTIANFSGLLNSTDYDVYYTLYKNGFAFNSAKIEFTTNGSGAASINKTVLFPNILLQNGDYVEVRLDIMKVRGGALVGPGVCSYTQATGSKFYNIAVTSNYGLNSPVDFGGFFSDQIKQGDFLKSVFKLFNLYIEPDPDYQNKLYIETRDDFYTNTVEDWSQLLDNSQDLEIIPMGALDANPYYFTYSQGEDDENKDYQSTFDRVYGDKKYFINNDFIKNEKKVDVIFAPTQIFKDPGYDKYLSYVPVQKGTGQLRLLIHGGLITCNSYKIYDTPMTGTSVTKTQYLFTSHIDSPTAPTLDLLFGMPRRINLPAGTQYTDNNLFNKYWSKHIKEITDKDSRIVTGYFKLSPARMERLSFRSIYYFKNNYFRLNKIEDYNPQELDTCRCEFLQITSAPEFTPSTGSIGSGGDLGGFIVPESNTKKGIDGSVLGKDALVVGKNNGVSGRQSLIVSDNIYTDPTNRILTVLGGSGISFAPDVSGAVVIQSTNQNIEDSDVLMIHDTQVDLSTPNDGDVLTYDSATNTWQAQSTGTKVKQSDTTRSLDDTLTDDTTLKFYMKANTVYNIDLKVYFDTTAAADFKWAITGPSSPTLVRGLARHFNPGGTTEVVSNFVAYVPSDSITGSGTNGGWLWLNLVVQNGVNAGDFKFQWGQNTSDAGQTKVLAGSIITWQ